jgi:hypothetical protein
LACAGAYRPFTFIGGTAAAGRAGLG